MIKHVFLIIKENRPYDLMVSELIDPKMPGYQKPVQTTSNGRVEVKGSKGRLSLTVTTWAGQFVQWTRICEMVKDQWKIDNPPKSN